MKETLPKDVELQLEIQRIVSNEEYFASAKKEFEREMKTDYGLDFVVDPEVFPPFYFDASIRMAQRLALNFLENTNIKNILAIGIGSGIDFVPLITTCTDQSAKIPNLYGTEINPKAIQNTQNNFDFLDSRLKLFQTDILLDINVKYDLTCWNIPFFGQSVESYGIDQGAENHFLGSRFDQNYKSLNSNLKQLRYKLHRDGKLILMFSEFGKDRIENIILENGFEICDQESFTVTKCIRQPLPEHLHFEVFVGVYTPFNETSKY